MICLLDSYGPNSLVSALFVAIVLGLALPFVIVAMIALSANKNGNY